MTPRLMHFKILVVAAIALSGFVATLPAQALGTPRGRGVRDRSWFRPVAGTFTDPGGQTSNVTTTDGITYHFKEAGGTDWAGSLTGTTRHHGSGTIDTSTGTVHELLAEHFTGTLFGVGGGTLDLVDLLVERGDGSGFVYCFVVGSSGALTGLRGGLRFTWPTTGADGRVAGTYSGAFLGRVG